MRWNSLITRLIYQLVTHIGCSIKKTSNNNFSGSHFKLDFNKNTNCLYLLYSASQWEERREGRQWDLPAACLGQWLSILKSANQTLQVYTGRHLIGQFGTVARNASDSLTVSYRLNRVVTLHHILSLPCSCSSWPMGDASFDPRLEWLSHRTSYLPIKRERKRERVKNGRKWLFDSLVFSQFFFSPSPFFYLPSCSRTNQILPRQQ